MEYSIMLNAIKTSWPIGFIEGWQVIISKKYCIFSLKFIFTLNIQWATLVTHHLFRAHILWRKFCNRTFSMIIYLLTFYLFDDIEKNIKITHANQSATSNTILTKLLVQLERLYFLFAFCTRNYPWWSLWQKNTKNNCFIQVKPPFLVVEVSNTVTFWRNARFDVILTSVTIIKKVFFCKLFCYESLVDIKVSKHKNILSLTCLIALIVVTSSLTSTPWSQLIH